MHPFPENPTLTLLAHRGSAATPRRRGRGGWKPRTAWRRSGNEVYDGCRRD